MIHASLIAAVAVAALAAEGPAASGNYSGLHKMVAPTAQHQLKATPLQERHDGRVIEDHSSKLERGPCGMPIIAATSAIDPKIIVPRTDESKKSANAPAVSPGGCGPFAVVPARRR